MQCVASNLPYSHTRPPGITTLQMRLRDGIYYLRQYKHNLLPTNDIEHKIKKNKEHL